MGGAMSDRGAAEDRDEPGIVRSSAERPASTFGSVQHEIVAHRPPLATAEGVIDGCDHAPRSRPFSYKSCEFWRRAAVIVENFRL